MPLAIGEKVTVKGHGEVTVQEVNEDGTFTAVDAEGNGPWTFSAADFPPPQAP